MCVWVPTTAVTRPSRCQPIPIFSLVASACMSTSTWSTCPLSACSAASASENARPSRVHEQVPRQRDDAEPHAVAGDDAPAVAGLAAQEVGGAQDPRGGVEVGVDLAMAVGVVAERDHVDPGGEQLVGDLRRDPHAAGGVLAVDDDERRRKALAQRGQQRQQRSPADPADDVADEQDAGGLGHGLSARILPPACVGFRRDLRPLSAEPEGADRDEPPGTRGPGAPSPSDWVSVRSGRSPPVIVPRWIQLVLLPIGLLGLWALARASGPVLLILIVASMVALVLNPLVKVLGARPAARAGDPARVPRLRSPPRPASACCCPTRSAPRSATSRTTSRIWSSRPTTTSPTSRAGSTGHGIKIQIQKQGQTALQTLQKRRPQALERHRLVLARPARQDRDDLVRLRAGARALGLPARLRQPDRRARAADHARRRRHARTTTSRCSSSARYPATCAGSCCSA